MKNIDKYSESRQVSRLYPCYLPGLTMPVSEHTTKKENIPNLPVSPLSRIDSEYMVNRFSFFIPKNVVF